MRSNKGRRRVGSLTSRKRADGSVVYRVRWSDHTGRHSRTFTDEHQAEVFMLRLERDISHGLYQPPTKRTVSESLDIYLERSRRDKAPGTLRAYRQHARDYIKPYIGRVKLSNLTTPLVQQWIDRLLRETDLTGSTIRRAAQVLSGCCREAAQMGEIERNPVTGVRLPRENKVTTTVWTIEEIRAVLEALADEEPRWYGLYVLALTTGMRPGELRALMWDSVDLDHGIIHVRRTMSIDEGGSSTVRDGTKSGRDRMVVIDDGVAEVLRRIPRRNEFVFPGEHVDALAASSWRQFHERLCKKARVRTIRLHDLRHANATISLYLGTSSKVVSERLGHSTVRMTLDRYTHVVAELHRSAATELASVLGVAHDNKTPLSGG